MIHSPSAFAWKKDVAAPLLGRSGFLSTAGGVVFHSSGDGNLEAYDAKTGDLLWQFQRGFSVAGPASTYEIDGEQYVAVPSGPVVWAFVRR